MGDVIKLPRWTTASRIESYYGLQPGRIRKWIFNHRYLSPSEYRKEGRDWFVKVSAVERILVDIGEDDK